MVKWIKVTKNQCLGFFALGLAFFVFQELPYILMPLMPSLQSNPLMEMHDKYLLLNIAEKALGVSCIIVMLFIVRRDAKWFSLRTSREKIFFSLAMIAIAGNFLGWAFYYCGYQSLPLILCTLVALPPVYYTFIGLWRGNNAQAIIGFAFLVVHILNVWNNLM